MLNNFIICIALLGLYSGIHAQPAPPASGIVLGLGAGYGKANSLCIPCGESSTPGGLSVASEVGIRFNRQWKAAFEVYYWSETQAASADAAPPAGKPPTSRLMLLMTATYMPFGNLPIYLKAGAGWGNHFTTPSRPVRTDQGDSTLSSFVTLGFTGVLQTGYEIRVTNTFYIVPHVSYYQTWLGNLEATTGQTLHNEKPSRTWDLGVRFILQGPFNNKQAETGSTHSGK